MGYVLQLKWNIFDICWTLMAFSPVLWCTKRSVTIIAVQKLLINESKKYGVLATYLLPIVLNLLISGEGKTQILRPQPRRWGGPLRCLALTLQNLWQITCDSDLDLGPSFPRWVTTSYFSLELFSWMHQNVRLFDVPALEIYCYLWWIKVVVFKKMSVSLTDYVIKPFLDLDDQPVVNGAQSSQKLDGIVWNMSANYIPL